ncbi:hypothetical protein BH23BAC3_BH23BAC3_26570 [soil metagenome]
MVLNTFKGYGLSISKYFILLFFCLLISKAAWSQHWVAGPVIASQVTNTDNFTGNVYEDANHNGRFDGGETPALLRDNSGTTLGQHRQCCGKLRQLPYKPRSCISFDSGLYRIRL